MEQTTIEGKAGLLSDQAAGLVNGVVARTPCTALVVWSPSAAPTAELMQKSRRRDNLTKTQPSGPRVHNGAMQDLPVELETGVRPAATAGEEEASAGLSRHRNSPAKDPIHPRQGQTVFEPKQAESDELGRQFLESTGLAALAQRVADSAEQIRLADATAAGLLHASLAPLLALDAAKLVKQPGLEEACALRGVPFTERTKKNPDLVLLRLTFPGMDGKRASRCARALQFARRNKVGADTFEQFAASKGGIDGCIQAAMEARGRPSGNRARRAKQLVVTLAPDLPDGECAILVRVTGRRAVYVKEVPM